MSYDFTSGAFLQNTLPEGQRTYYEQLLLATLRKLNIFTRFCITKEDFRARDTGQLVYTEVFDAAPNWNPLAETDYWLPGAHLDSRQITINLEIHGDIMKFND